MRPRWWAVWAAFVLTLVSIELGIVTGALRIDPITNFYFVITAIAAIGILAIVGAVFIGIFVSHRILSRQEFTPFEREMLGMREDLKVLAAKIDALQASERPRKPA